MPVEDIPFLQRRYIGVVGDLHGNKMWTSIALRTLANSGITEAVQLGDFGLMGDVPRWCEFVNKILDELKMTLLVVPGNHENYDWLDDEANFEVDNHGIRWVKSRSKKSVQRIGILPRGFRWEQQGKSIMALGGASSIDITHRTKGKTWWEGENITEQEADAIISDLGGSRVDVMFTHDAPRDVMALAELAARNASDWELNELAYAETSRARLDRVFRCAQPKLLMHGHWHFFVDEFGEFESNWTSNGEWSDEVVDHFESRIVGLDMDNSIQNVAVLDLSKLEVTVLEREIAIETGKPVGERRIFEG